MARSKFVAPRTVENNQQISKALRDIQEALDALSQGTYVLGLKTTDFSPAAPSYTRVSPPTSGVRVVLPRPAPENAGLTITFAIENPQGTLTVFASNGTKVNGGATSVFTAAGIVELLSNGVDQWASTNQLSLTSPSGTAEVVLGAPSASFPNGRVATDSVEIDAVLTTPNVISWALNVASVVFAKLQDLTGLSVLGRAATTTGVMAAITSTAARQVLQNNDAGNGLQWGFPVELRNASGADQGDVFSLRFNSGNRNTANATQAAGSATISYDWNGFITQVNDVDTNTATNTLDFDNSTSIVATAIAPVGTEANIAFERAALTGAITAAQNSNTTAFGTMAADTFFGNFTAGVAVPAPVAGSTVAGAGLTYTTGGILAVGAGTGITVNANDVAVNQAANFTWTGTHSFGSTVFGVGKFSATLAGTVSDLAIGAVNAVILTLTGSQTLTGMVPQGDGQWVWLENTDNLDALTLANDATSVAANRFFCPALRDYQVPPHSGVWCRYNSTLSRWLVADAVQFLGISIREAPTVVSSIKNIGLKAGESTVMHKTAPGALDDVDLSVDYVGSTSNITLTGITGNQGTVSISALKCGGSVFVSAPVGDWQIEGFSGNNTDGFWFNIFVGNSEFLGTLFDEDATATATNRLRCPGARDIVDSRLQAVIFYSSGTRWSVIANQPQRPAIHVLTANATATNATTNLSVTTFTTAAASFRVGTAYRMTGFYQFDHQAAATPTITIELLVGATVLQTVVITPVATLSAFSGTIVATIVCRTVGAGGTMMCTLQAPNNYGNGTIEFNAMNDDGSTVADALDTTTTNTFLLRARMTTAVASNTLTIVQGMTERLA